MEIADVIKNFRGNYLETLCVPITWCNLFFCYEFINMVVDIGDVLCWTILASMSPGIGSVYSFLNSFLY